MGCVSGSRDLDARACQLVLFVVLHKLLVVLHKLLVRRLYAGRMLMLLMGCLRF